MSITNPLLPNSNPLGNDVNGGTTGSNLGKVTTGGQDTNVKQDSLVDGTAGVALSQQDMISMSSTLKAMDQTNLSSTGAPDPSNPVIPGPRSFDISNAASVGAWFSTFLSHLSENYYIISMLGKKIHLAEGKMSTQMLQRVWNAAVQTAALIMAKAQTEANMHMALAISALVGLAVSVAGTALSLAGKMKSSSAKAKEEALDVDTPKTPSSTNLKAGAHSSVGSDRARTDTTVTPEDNPAQTLMQPAQRPNSPQVQANARPGDVDAPQEYRPLRPDQPAPLDRPANARQQDQAANVQNDAAVPSAANPVAGANQSSRPAGDTNAPDAVGQAQPAPATTERAKLEEQKNLGKSMGIVGAGMQAAANSIREVIDNVIQMIYKPILANYDGDIEKERATKELASKALDSSAQGFSGATDLVNAANQGMDKLGDVVKANRIGNG